MRRKLVAGNWKMHGSLAANASLLAGVREAIGGLECDVLVCPPYPYLAQAGVLLSDCGVLLGAQSVSEHVAGAFTGEVAVSMLSELGCSHVLVGHSERRTLFGESDQVVAAKVEAVLRGGLVPVLCVGETLAEREAGTTDVVVCRQLQAVVDLCGPSVFGGVVVAYEPVWAIGTGRTASPEQAQAVHAAIRAFVAACDESLAQDLRILYGGSVKPGNAQDLFGQADIDGGLIGGASLVVEDFLAICRAAH